MTEFLWATGLARLLRERGIKATVLAEHANVPASRISELKKSDRPFIPLVQQLVDGLNAGRCKELAQTEGLRLHRNAVAADG